MRRARPSPLSILKRINANVTHDLHAAVQGPDFNAIWPAFNITLLPGSTKKKKEVVNLGRDNHWPYR